MKSNGMDANEAMIWCLSGVKVQSDGDVIVTRTVFDCEGAPHWIEWKLADCDDAVPQFCSECDKPFVASRAPYRRVGDA